MDNLHYLINDGVSATLDYITKMYHKGEIEGLIIGMKNKNGEFSIINSDTINYLEAIGLTQCMTQHLVYKHE
jgi:hypothetical protein